LATAAKLQERRSTTSRQSTPPLIALGGGVTLAAVLNILRDSGVPTYTLCPEHDFVRRSRWYRPLEVQQTVARPEHLEAMLEVLALPKAVLLPCSDDWLRAVAALPPALAARFPSSTPGAHNVETFTDKWKFAQLLSTLRIPHPRTHLIRTLADIDELHEIEGAILKPLSSVAFASRYGVKGYIVESLEQARSLLQRLELPILVQEFIPGPPTAGYFLDGFRDRRGSIKGLFARRRLRMHPRKLGNSTFLTSVPLDEVQSALFSLEYLLEQTRYRGIFSAEFKLDPRDQTFKLIEINARPWWYVEFAARCGVDVCSMAYWDALGVPVEAATSYEIGRTCIFAANDFRAFCDSETRDGSGWWSLLRGWFQAHSTPFHWNDPAPAFFYLRQEVAAYFAASSRLVRQAKSLDRDSTRSSLNVSPRSS
jgi:predicted ATP-grasp superfamily ATP-dependent carboligase